MSRRIRELGQRPDGVEIVRRPHDMTTHVYVNGVEVAWWTDLQELVASEMVIDWSCGPIPRLGTPHDPYEL